MKSIFIIYLTFISLNALAQAKNDEFYLRDKMLKLYDINNLTTVCEFELYTDWGSAEFKEFVSKYHLKSRYSNNNRILENAKTRSLYYVFSDNRLIAKKDDGCTIIAYNKNNRDSISIWKNPSNKKIKVLKSIEYNNNGRCKSILEIHKNDTVNTKTILYEYSYNKNSREVKKYNYSNNDTTKLIELIKTTYDDLKGYKSIKIIDDKIFDQWYEEKRFNKSGQLILEDQYHQKSKFEYNNQGNLINEIITSPSLFGEDKSLINYSYDDTGNCREINIITTKIRSGKKYFSTITNYYSSEQKLIRKDSFKIKEIKVNNTGDTIYNKQEKLFSKIKFCK